MLPGNVGRRGKRGARLADELAMSNSDNEIPETQASRRATMCNKEPLDTKSIQSESKDNDKVHVRRGGTLDAYTLPVGTPAPISKSRPQRRKRSMEERLPDFLMEVSQVLKSVHQAPAAEFYILCNIFCLSTLTVPGFFLHASRKRSAISLCLLLQVPGGGERRTGGRGGKRARRGEREQTSIGARNGERELTTQKRGDSNHTGLANVGIFILFFVSVLIMLRYLQF